MLSYERVAIMGDWRTCRRKDTGENLLACVSREPSEPDYITYNDTYAWQEQIKARPRSKQSFKIGDFVKIVDTPEAREAIKACGGNWPSDYNRDRYVGKGAYITDIEIREINNRNVYVLNLDNTRSIPCWWPAESLVPC